MTKKNVIRKATKVGVALVALVILLVISSTVPMFKSVECEIKDNCITVQRNNPYATAVDITAIKVDANGNSEEISVEVPLEGDNESYTFNEDDFKKLVNTEDTIYILEMDETIFSMISNRTVPVAIANAILLAACIFLVFYLIFQIPVFKH